MLEKHAALELISNLQSEMQTLNLWQDAPLPEDAFSSAQPFAVDKMKFEQWLQFILIPTLTTILKNNLPMPKSFGITPMAEHCFGNTSEFQGMMQIIKNIDNGFSN